MKKRWFLVHRAAHLVIQRSGHADWGTALCVFAFRWCFNACSAFSAHSLALRKYFVMLELDLIFQTSLLIASSSVSSALEWYLWLNPLHYHCVHFAGSNFLTIPQPHTQFRHASSPLHPCLTRDHQPYAHAVELDIAGCGAHVVSYLFMHCCCIASWILRVNEGTVVH